MLPLRRLVVLAPLLAALGAGQLLVATGADEPPPRPADGTLGQKPPEGAQVLIGPGSSLAGWVAAGHADRPAQWPMADGVVTVARGNIQTTATFGDFTLHVEFNVPDMPDQRGQARGNSGVYLQGIYELQVLDSYGLTPQNNDCGAIYQQVVPKVNACKPPLQWQTYDITFHAAQRDPADASKVTRKAHLTVVQNGLTIIDDAEIRPTPGGVAGVREGGPGPIMLQDHNNTVRYRNVWLAPLKP